MQKLGYAKAPLLLQEAYDELLRFKQQAKDERISVAQARCLAVLQKQPAGAIDIARASGIMRTTAYMALEALAHTKRICKGDGKTATYRLKS